MHEPTFAWSKKDWKKNRKIIKNLRDELIKKQKIN